MAISASSIRLKLYSALGHGHSSYAALIFSINYFQSVFSDCLNVQYHNHKGWLKGTDASRSELPHKMVYIVTGKVITF